MNLFYSKNIFLKPQKLSKEESLHCIRVLRKKENDELFITEGKGIIYIAKITTIKNDLVNYSELTIHSKFNRKTNSHIFISLPKKRSRFEWFLEKVTEIGVDTISPLVCKNSEREKINFNRCQRILIAAIKQSKNHILPQLTEPILFKEAIKNQVGHAYLAHCYSSEKKIFKEVLLESKNPKKISLFIGPEGDFSKKELNFANAENIIPISLGQNILRTETAGIVGCNMINLLT
tara:strand:+ start:261 stop:962 length:702 start_codon:yes stop_codon:yes gene_type:complete